jgi:hypothetical protein
MTLFRAELDPGTRSLASCVGGIDPFADDTFQTELAHRLKNLSRRRSQQRRQAQRLLGDCK